MLPSSARSEPDPRGGSEKDQATFADRDASSRRKIISYFAILNLSVGLGTPLTGLAAIPINYILKDQLNLSPFGLAMFISIASAPAYVGFLFGFIRDRWRPRIWGDFRLCRIYSRILTVGEDYFKV